MKERDGGNASVTRRIRDGNAKEREMPWKTSSIETLPWSGRSKYCTMVAEAMYGAFLRQ